MGANAVRAQQRRACLIVGNRCHYSPGSRVWRGQLQPSKGRSHQGKGRGVVGQFHACVKIRGGRRNRFTRQHREQSLSFRFQFSSASPLGQPPQAEQDLAARDATGHQAIVGPNGGKPSCHARIFPHQSTDRVRIEKKDHNRISPKSDRAPAQVPGPPLWPRRVLQHPKRLGGAGPASPARVPLGSRPDAQGSRPQANVTVLQQVAVRSCVAPPRSPRGYGRGRPAFRCSGWPLRLAPVLLCRMLKQCAKPTCRE